MTAEEFVKTIWICEPPKGSLEVKDVISAMEQYAKSQIPTDEVIEGAMMDMAKAAETDLSYICGFEEGAKWLKSKLTKTP